MALIIGLVPILLVLGISGAVVYLLVAREARRKELVIELPIPTHLKDHFVPLGDKNTGRQVSGAIRCSCGCGDLAVWSSNERRLVIPVCGQCEKIFLLFDAGRHGWNGFVCGEDPLVRSEPVEEFCCPKCGQSSFGIGAVITSQGKEDFCRQALTGEDDLTPEDWVNAFDYIGISLRCRNCGWTDRRWSRQETL
ncbi:MAG: hypothetical protein IJ412_07020 [Oscillospiraceae bacterium]|nr:hypothetical protein [Oscillospiraceae bacterium]